MSASPEADGDDRLRAIVRKARYEGWSQTQFDDAFVAEMKRQNRPVGQLEIQVGH